MLRCQQLRFDQQLGRLWLSHQFLLEVFGFTHTHTPDTNATQIFHTPHTRMVTSILFFFFFLKFHPHSGTTVIISRRNS